MKKLLFPLILAGSFLLRGQATFSFNVNGSPPPGFAQALVIAGQKWSNWLQITVPVKVNVFTVNSSFIPFSAITLANGRRNFSNAPHTNILYVSSLANQLAGTELNPGEYDMDIYFNLATSFYYGSGLPPASSDDFITTAMHEIGHGLGFYSDGYVDGSGNGSFGNIPPSAIAPLTSSFPWRGLDSIPTIFDTYIVRTSNNPLSTSAPANSTALGDSIKNGALYFSGPLYANPSHSNTPVRLSGGAGTYTLGVDLLHIHDSYANTIMSYYWGPGDTVRTPAPWEIGILREIGWNLKPPTPVNTGLEKTTAGYARVSSFPNPADASLIINGKDVKDVKLYTLLGEPAQTVSNVLKEEELYIGTSGLKDGVYFLKITFYNDERDLTKKVIIKH
jgi:hypothetical protein